MVWCTDLMLLEEYKKCLELVNVQNCDYHVHRQHVVV